MITRTTCRACNAGNLVDLFSLGEQYVSDFVDREHIYGGVKAPLDLVLCGDCGLVQLRHTAPQELLYSRKYWYRSGVTATMCQALDNVARAVEQRVFLQPGDVVLDIGSNDGTLLRCFSAGIKVGVEPATNLAEQGSRGLDVFINDFWSEWAYVKHAGEHGKAKVICAIGMFYDLENPSAFIADVAKVLAPDGLFVAQLMCLRNMLRINDVGNLCHEHLEYYSLGSLDRLLRMHGLEVVDMETNAVNGESYRFYIRHVQSTGPTVCAKFQDAWVKEIQDGLNNPAFYREFFARMDANKARVVEFVRGEVAKGKRVWVYGASTKGNVILQFYGLDHELIEGAADRSPDKWGKFTVGTGIRIHSEEDARKAKPDYFLVLPYAFLKEFIAREQAWLHAGGKFIVPLPELMIVGAP